MSLFGKTITLIVITAVLVGGIVYWTSYFMLSSAVFKQSQADVRKMAEQVRIHVDDMRDRATTVAAVLSERADLIAAVEKGDSAAVRNIARGYVKSRQVSVLTIADRNGKVIGRGHSDKTGDSVLGQANVKKALAGQATTGVEEGTVVKFSLRAGNPVRSGNTVVGSVTAGFDLASDAFVDEMKKYYGVECTIFQGDTRVATTIMTGGKRAVGTKMDNQRVLDTVLAKGEIFLNVNKILGRNYDTAYWPIKDVDGKIVGMFFIGKDRAQTERALMGTIIPAFAAAIVIGFIIVAVNYLSVRSAVRTLNRAIRGLSASHGQVSAAANHITASSQELADSTSTQAASLEETSSSLEEMSSMSKTTLENSNLMAETGDRSYQAMRSSHKSLRETSDCMKRIGVSGAQAAKIIKASDEIAFQINLLALNAAVEAARAGETGAGFAVVAEEVRSLAMRSAEAAKNTEKILGEMLQEIDNGNSLVARTLQDFYLMGEEGKKTNELIKAIDSSMKEQAQGIEQINRAVSEMDKVTQRTAAGAEESAGTAEELKAQAAQMQDHVKGLQAVVGGNVYIRADKAKEAEPAIPDRPAAKLRGTAKAALPAPAAGRGAQNPRTKIKKTALTDEGDFRDF